VAKRKKLKETSVVCGVCVRHYAIDDLAERSAEDDDGVQVIERSALDERERQTRLTTLPERQRTRQYHVFLCHNSRDKPLVRQLAQRLLTQGVLPWFDEEVILAGERFPRKLEDALDTARVVAIIIGPQGMGRWQDMEYQAAIQRSIEERDTAERPSLRVIPVLLPGVPADVELPVFLRGLHNIDLREGGVENKDALRTFVQSILGREDRFADPIN
jgi:hypothetical protein